MSCENLDEVKQWYLNDRQTLSQKQCGEYLVNKAELGMDTVQVSTFFVEINQ